MKIRLTEQLRNLNDSTWTAVVNHRFVKELASGVIDDRVMANYLIQDYRFLENFLILIGSAISNADTLSARLHFGRFAGMICSEENTYFLRAFNSLGISEQQLKDQPNTESTTGFKNIMIEATETGSYAAILAVLNVAEWSYFEWAKQASYQLPENFIHAEWITLHNNTEFSSFVCFLRKELDRVGPGRYETSLDFFTRTVGLEKKFFDSVYFLAPPKKGKCGAMNLNFPYG